VKLTSRSAWRSPKAYERLRTSITGGAAAGAGGSAAPIGAESYRSPCTGEPSGHGLGTVRAMARGTEFMSGDLGALEPLFEKLTAKRGRLERLTKAERWLIITPADKDAREVSVEFNIGKQVNNLVVTTTGFEPGKA